MIALLFYIEKHINIYMASSSSSLPCVVRPELQESLLLMMQETHVLQYIWNGHPDWVLVVRGKSFIHSKDEQIPVQIVQYLK